MASEREIAVGDRVTYDELHRKATGTTAKATVTRTHRHKGALYATVEWDEDGPTFRPQSILARHLEIVA